MAEFNITVTHTTSGKETVLAVEPEFSVASVLEVLAESLHLKDRFVLASKDNKILDPALTIKDAGIKEGDELLLMPDPTGGAPRQPPIELLRKHLPREGKAIGRYVELHETRNPETTLEYHDIGRRLFGDAAKKALRDEKRYLAYWARLHQG